MSDEELWWTMVITKMYEMAYLDIIHTKQVNPLVAWSERPPLPEVLI